MKNKVMLIPLGAGSICTNVLILSPHVDKICSKSEDKGLGPVKAEAIH